MKKERADEVLAKRGLAPSLEKARALIMAGLVTAAGMKVEKPGQGIDPQADISIAETLRYVGRGGLKLEEALDAFGVSVEGKTAADLGSSTGGFSDCLLQRGARKVVAVDVDLKQIDRRLRQDPRVVLMEKNARYLTRGDFDETPSIVTADLSFISILKVLPAIRGFLGAGDLIALIKPQFEAEKGKVGDKGVIRNPSDHERILTSVLGEAQKMGFFFRGLIKCSTRGQKGNREFLVHWRLDGQAANEEELRSRIREVVHEEKR